MIQNERDCRHEHVLDVARQMLTAARTAPKGKGIDVIEAALVTGEDIKKLSEKMVAMVEEHGMKFFLRDADNILQAECVIIIGTREQTQGLNCGHCGFPTCAGRPEGVPCALNTVDVGIAVGSACAMAADLREPLLQTSKPLLYDCKPLLVNYHLSSFGFRSKNGFLEDALTGMAKTVLHPFSQSKR